MLNCVVMRQGWRGDGRNGEADAVIEKGRGRDGLG